MAGHLFVSYSRTDRAYVERLTAHLAAAGFTVWSDHQVEPGEQFGPQIKQAIDTSVAVIPVLTPTSVESRWVIREIIYADERQRPMLPLVLAPCDPPLHLVGVQFESVVGGSMPGDRYIARLHALQGDGDGGPSPATPPPSARPPSPATPPSSATPPLPAISGDRVAAGADRSTTATDPTSTRPRRRRASKPVLLLLIGLATGLGLTLATTAAVVLADHPSPRPSDTHTPGQSANALPTAPTSTGTPTTGTTLVPPTLPSPDPAMAAFGQGWMHEATASCRLVSTDPRLEPNGLGTTGALSEFLCTTPSVPIAIVVGGAGVAFIEYGRSAQARDALQCGNQGTAVVNGMGGPPPGMRSTRVYLGGGSGGRVGYYCESTYTSIDSSSGQVTGVAIAISWTDATQPLAGHLQVWLPPVAMSTYTESIWTQLRDYWSAHT
jgi:hypothetical protein